MLTCQDALSFPVETGLCSAANLAGHSALCLLFRQCPGAAGRPMRLDMYDEFALVVSLFKYKRFICKGTMIPSYGMFSRRPVKWSFLRFVFWTSYVTMVKTTRALSTKNNCCLRLCVQSCVFTLMFNNNVRMLTMYSTSLYFLAYIFDPLTKLSCRQWDIVLLYSHPM